MLLNPVLHYLMVRQRQVLHFQRCHTEAVSALYLGNIAASELSRDVVSPPFGLLPFPFLPTLPSLPPEVTPSLCYFVAISRDMLGLYRQSAAVGMKV